MILLVPFHVGPMYERVISRLLDHGYTFREINNHTKQMEALSNAPDSEFFDGMLNPGEVAHFMITVYNQGTLDATYE